jgi:hypothetical protein
MLTNFQFTFRDYVRPEEQPEYAEICAALQSDLNPSGALEATFAMAIIGATWRLRRCSLIESDMSEIFSLDPMEDQAGSRTQHSVDRARSQAFHILRHATAELRRLQTDRRIRAELFPDTQPGIVGYRDVVRTLKQSAASGSAKLASNCNPPESTARNAPCPCGSGEKYKRCCGVGAAPILNKAA